MLGGNQYPIGLQYNQQISILKLTSKAKLRWNLSMSDVSADCLRVVVIGNQKGGCGKSTLAMHIIIALLKAGKRVASFDLDLDQQTLTRYIENRISWNHEKTLSLEIPDHCSMADVGVGSQRSYAVDVARFKSHLQTIQHDDAHDFIVIDTPGGLHNLSIVAHGIADTIITPINDSLLDLDVIVKLDRRHSDPQPSNYAKMVNRAIDARAKVCGLTTDWTVVRNRMAESGSRNQRQVDDVLEYVRERLGFRTVRGLPERVIFRELFAAGLTVFDSLEVSASNTLPSELPARSEIYQLLEEIGLLPPEISSDDKPTAPADEESVLHSEALVRFAPPANRSAAAARRLRQGISGRRRGK
jgi:chromosome partitioning protein